MVSETTNPGAASLALGFAAPQLAPHLRRWGAPFPASTPVIRAAGGRRFCFVQTCNDNRRGRLKKWVKIPKSRQPGRPTATA